MTVVWRDAAGEDLDRITEFIAQENPLAAQRIARALVLAADSLALFPRRGRPGRATGTREFVAINPYIIVYEVDDADDVRILRVWHAAQDR